MDLILYLVSFFFTNFEDYCIEQQNLQIYKNVFWKKNSICLF